MSGRNAAHAQSRPRVLVIPLLAGGRARLARCVRRSLLSVLLPFFADGAQSEAEDPLVARYRSDLVRIEPAASPARVDAEVAKFAAAVRFARTQPWPSSHAACAAVVASFAGRDCVLVVGDVVKPKWFAACKADGGSVIASTAPPGTPLHYDRAFCTRTFQVGE
jgi:hypothetical protein